MDTNPFLDKSHAPDETGLHAAFGKSAARWRKVTERLEREHGPLDAKWTYSGANYGWSLKLAQRKRAVVYLLPRTGGFLAAFALGDKACAAASAAKLPGELLELIDAAPRYVEGRAVRFAVRNERDVESVCTLATLKLAH